jgi:hypothetical protein
MKSLTINKIVKKNIKVSNSAFDFKSIQNRKKYDIEYMKNIYNLPIEIRNKVINAVIDLPPNYTECIYYSQYIASSIPNVKVEMGLYIYDDLHKNVPINFNQYKENSWVKYKFDDFESTSYIDENREVWGIHCWNSFNGIHFDCLKDFLFKLSDKKVWIDYKQIRSMSFELPNYQIMKLLSTSIKSVILNNRN